MNNIHTLLEALESFDEATRNMALQTILADDTLKQQAEARYLHFIQARLNNPAATLEQYEEAALTEKQAEKFIKTSSYDNHFGDDYISFQYCNDATAKLIVDVIGSLVKNAINIQEYIDAARKCQNNDELQKLHLEYATLVKESINKYIEIAPNGYWSKIATKLIAIRLTILRFDHSSFDEANTSLVRKEFFFFLDVICSYSMTFDIFQSDAPDMSDIFWEMKHIPSTMWGDVDVNLPDSHMKYERTALVKEDDFGDWEVVNSNK